MLFNRMLVNYIDITNGNFLIATFALVYILIVYILIYILIYKFNI